MGPSYPSHRTHLSDNLKGNRVEDPYNRNLESVFLPNIFQSYYYIQEELFLYQYLDQFSLMKRTKLKRKFQGIYMQHLMVPCKCSVLLFCICFLKYKSSCLYIDIVQQKRERKGAKVREFHLHGQTLVTHTITMLDGVGHGQEAP